MTAFAKSWRRLRAMLRPLGIRTRSVWPRKGVEGDHSGKGYYRSDFESAWRSYLDEDAAPASAAVRLLGA